MREKLKENTKIKLISLLSAVVLWMYVMAVVDPEETKLFEGVPIVITNLNDLKDNDLVVAPGEELVTNIYVTGKLSNLQKIKKDDINIYGQINNPMEGQNQVHMKASGSQRVSYEFKNSVKSINLEKIIQEKRTIEVKVEGKSKNNIDTITLDPDMDSINIVGPRSLVKEVQKIVGVLNSESKKDDFSQDISLKPINSDGDTIDGVDLEIDKVKANVTLLKEKTVPIKVKLADENVPEGTLNNYKLSQDTVTIKGNKDLIASIESISTEPISLSDLEQSLTKEVYLEIPKNISLSLRYITIDVDNSNRVVQEFVYNLTDIDIRNKKEGIDISKLSIPEPIKVKVEYKNELGQLSKNDIKLYVDMSEETQEKGVYTIKYESKYDILTVSINPDKLNIEE